MSDKVDIDADMLLQGAAVLVSVGLLVASRRMALGGWLGKY